MKRPRRNRPLVLALSANAVLLGAILVALLSRPSAPSLIPAAFGRDPQPIAGGGGLFLMPAQFSSTTWGCYIMDIDSQTICAYEYVPRNAKERLRLVAARYFRHDRRLKDFNTDPDPEEIRKLVEIELQGPRGLRGDGGRGRRDEADDADAGGRGRAPFEEDEGGADAAAADEGVDAPEDSGAEVETTE